ncbi:exo-alpha-sialidase [Prosthecobacter fusiformis]|nr:sialidase family protein [Prosthecobacter fusiformis]
MKLCLAFLFLSSLSAVAQSDDALPQSILDLPLKPVFINTNPGPEYSDEQRDYAMIIGADRTPKGRIWAAWVSGGDSPRAYFVAASSDDEGQTWSKPRLVIDPPDAPTGLEISALVGNFWTDPTGRLWLFYDQSLSMFDGRAGLWAITCDNPDDDKPVWSEPRRIWHGMTLNKPTVLSNGEWMLPISLWTRDRIGVAELKENGYSDLDEVRMANVFVSTDKGSTWTRRGGVMFPHTNFDEHMVVELKDKRLWMLARTSKGISESFSSDQGRTWTEPQLSQIKNLSARFFIRRLISGNIVLIKNGGIDETLKSRSHMTAFLSDDEGATWKGGLLLDERNGVSYPDGFQSPDGSISIFHDRGRGSEREIIMHRFTEADILAGKLVTPASKTKMLVNKATGPKITGRLYNGIELPTEWPPQNGDAKSYEPMPVPYLKDKPKVFPIQTKRQLFVDDFLIEKTDLKRTWHQARKHEKNPVFKPETKDELEPVKLEGNDQAVCYLGHGGVFHDPKENLYKMFYTAGWRGGLAMATSKDLLTWTRPNMGTVGGNILLPPGSAWAGGDNSVWLDVNAKDPMERVKLLTDRRPLPHTLQTSPNGKVWSQGVNTGKAGDYCSFFYNPFRKVWCFSIKQGGTHGRNRWYSENEDFIKGADWSKSVFWCNADKLDEPDAAIGDPAQLYSLNAVAYESLMLGQFYIHLGPDNKVCNEGKFPKITEIKLGFSRDGFHWDRPDRRAFIAATRKEGDWDRAYIHGTTGVCIVKEDEIWFPYTGYSGIAPNGAGGMYTGASVGMAVLRRDGFASMDAGDQAGSLTTEPVAFTSRQLFVNVAAPKGELRVEVLDEDGQVVAPYTLANCKPITGDSTQQLVEWKDAPTLDGVRGKPVKFRFHLTQGSLYSFWTK